MLFSKFCDIIYFVNLCKQKIHIKFRSFLNEILGGVKMAKCSICGKGVTFGHNVSHSNRKTNRTCKPNIRKVKAVVNGTNCTVSVCSRCLRSGKIERA